MVVPYRFYIISMRTFLLYHSQAPLHQRCRCATPQIPSRNRLESLDISLKQGRELGITNPFYFEYFVVHEGRAPSKTHNKKSVKQCVIFII